jgi:hypothetical protein
MKDELQNHLIKVLYKKLSNYSKKKERKNRLGVNRTFWFHYDKWWSQWKEGLFPLWAQLIKSSVSNIHLPISLLYEQSLSLSLTHTNTLTLTFSLYLFLSLLNCLLFTNPSTTFLLCFCCYVCISCSYFYSLYKNFLSFVFWL